MKREPTDAALLRRLLRAAEPFVAVKPDAICCAKTRALDPLQRNYRAFSAMSEPHITPRRFLNLLDAVEAARSRCNAKAGGK